MSPHDTKSKDAPVNEDAPPPYDPDQTGQANGRSVPSIDEKKPLADEAPLIELALAEDNSEQHVYVDSCVAHLKLLHAIQALKEDIGYTDGLWGLWDKRAEYGDNDLDDGVSDIASTASMAPEERKKLILSKIREKRWALFVSRAVDRYESWWYSFEQEMLTENEMSTIESVRYIEFTTAGKPMMWIPKMLPPLGEDNGNDEAHLFATDLRNRRRRSHGVAFSHAESAMLSGGYHEIWPP